MTQIEPGVWAVSAVMLALACTGGSSSDGEIGDTSGRDGDGDADGTSDGDSTADSTDGADGDGDTDSTETGNEGRQCPLDEQAGIEVLTLTPALFADGADPSGSPACEIVNPERGFYQFVDMRSLDADTLLDAAADGISVLYGQVLLPEFIDAPLDVGVLTEIDDAFGLARTHGMKVVPRFHYSDSIDQPDADLARILEHIDQLTPILEDHADVILTLQAGFIGAWGEWHSSQNGLDAPGPRKQVLDALLAALPESRTVSVRRPSFKQEAYGGPLTAETAHDASALARVGHINDCFLASDDDQGTYQVPGEKDYAINDSQHVPVGGETCAVNPPRSECPAALDELALHHWTHLNRGYHPDVIAGWEQDGCFDQIACRLGYRLAVLELQWAASAGAGDVLPVSITIFNDGFAAPVNFRPVVLVFDGPERFEVPVPDVDPRTWLAGEQATICVDADLPGAVRSGTYRIGLRLRDPDPELAEDPRQAIRLVNGEWDPGAGVSWFDATVEVE